MGGLLNRRSIHLESMNIDSQQYESDTSEIGDTNTTENQSWILSNNEKHARTINGKMKIYSPL
jgi:hypothetical protein